MMDQTPKTRAEINKFIDAIPVELRKSFDEELAGGPRKEQLKEVFRDFPLISEFPDEFLEEFVKLVVNFMVKKLMAELEAFVNYWRHQIPTDEELSKMTEGEIEENILDRFMNEMEVVFMAFMENFTESLHKK